MSKLTEKTLTIDNNKALIITEIVEKVCGSTVVKIHPRSSTKITAIPYVQSQDTQTQIVTNVKVKQTVILIGFFMIMTFTA